MDLYLIRHGKSEANAAGTHSGWSPVDLTEEGIREVTAARRLLEGLCFERIYVSDVKRAQQTAGILFPDREYIFCPLIRELNNTAMRGKTAEEMLALFPDLYPEARRAFDYACLGLDCESGPHLRARAAEFLAMVQSEEPIRFAAVCHGGFIRACAAEVLSAPTHNPPMDCHNASVNILSFRKGYWRISGWNLRADE